MRIGAVELTPLTDAVGQLGELDELYPGVPAEAWQPYRELYPELFVQTRWRLPCTCFLIRSGGRTVLVDTGVGPPGLWGWTPEREGGLFPALAEQGVEPGDIDVVFNTHIHIDHVGWNTSADGETLFPNARYLLHPDALSCARGKRSDQPDIARCVLPLVERGLVTEVEEAEVAPDVFTLPLPGHDPGHTGLRIASRGEEAILIADAAVHPALLDEPDWPYVSDGDHDECRATREAFLAEVVDSKTLVGSGHYPGSGIGRVETRDGRVAWIRAG